MTEPIPFPSTTAQLSLPLLFPGQAQKEFFLNQAFAMIDALIPRTVLASLASPPSVAEDGQCYRVLDPASGEWTGHENSLALRIGGAWHQLQPSEGMTVYDAEAGSVLFYAGGWRFASEPTVPQTGTVIDIEARQTLSDLIKALGALGILRIQGTI